MSETLKKYSFNLYAFFMCVGLRCFFGSFCSIGLCMIFLDAIAIYGTSFNIYNSIACYLCCEGIGFALANALHRVDSEKGPLEIQLDRIIKERDWLDLAVYMFMYCREVIMTPIIVIFVFMFVVFCFV